ncbi:MAG: LamG domain-containing protein [Saprospiraceae bacterium]|nr:LamG domain-containing protein [Candidatus Defluviibacterium haderslevense]
MKRNIIFSFLFSLVFTLGCEKECEVKVLTISDFDSALYAYYPFNNSLNDIGPLNLNGANNGASFTVDRNNNNNSALQFNGASYVSLPDQFDLEERSICFWFKVNSITGTNKCLLSYHHLGLKYGATNIVVANRNGIDGVGIDNQALGVSTFDRLSNPTSWHHIVVASSKNTIRTYIDGSLVYAQLKEAYSQPNIGASELLLGTAYNLTQQITGSIDELRVYNRLLSEEEIAILVK